MQNLVETNYRVLKKHFYIFDIQKMEKFQYIEKFQVPTQFRYLKHQIFLTCFNLKILFIYL